MALSRIPQTAGPGFTYVCEGCGQHYETPRLVRRLGVVLDGWCAVLATRSIQSIVLPSGRTRTSYMGGKG